MTNEAGRVFERLAQAAERRRDATSPRENPERDHEALETFMEHLALKQGVNINDIRHYRNKRFRRGFYHVTETVWDVGKFFAGGVGAQWLYQLAGATAAGVNAVPANPKIPKFVQTVAFFAPIFFLRRYAKLVNENRATLDAARVADKVWSNSEARQRVLSAIRDNNSGEFDKLQKEFDRHPATKFIRKWLPRALAFSSGVGIGAVGYQGLVSFVATLYASPQNIPGALVNLPLTGLEEIKKIGLEASSHIKEGALGVWSYLFGGEAKIK